VVFTLVGYSESISPNVLQNVAGIPDPHVTVDGDDIIVPAFANMILGCWGCGTTLDRVKLVSPELRKITNVEISPLNRGEQNTLDPVRLALYKENPIQLATAEALNGQAIHSAAAAEQQTIVVALCDGRPTPVEGANIRTVRCTSKVTLTAYQWTNGAIEFDETLPSGTYRIVGMRAESAGLIAARLVLVGYHYRPGVPGVQTALHKEAEQFRMGRMGVFGEFEHTTPPTVDFLSSSADTSEVVLLDLVKV